MVRIISPSKMMLSNLDVMIFDIQDVGVRYYTYISTLHYIMESCAEESLPLIVMDRPNPNGYYVDGPVLDTAFRSFVGMHPIPIVYGLTIGELATMIEGEAWINNAHDLSMKIIRCINYDHTTSYSLPIKPSPNLPNDRSIYLYPSLCLFEGTIISVGRGTSYPFQIIGSPYHSNYDFDFTPMPTDGSSNPKYSGQLCFGKDLRDRNIVYDNHFFLTELIEFYKHCSKQEEYFNSYFDKLIGNKETRRYIESGMSKVAIRSTCGC